MITTRGGVPRNLSKISSTLLVSGQALGTGVGWPPMMNPGMGPMRVAHTIMTEMAATSVQPIAFSHSYSLGFSYGMFTYKRLCRHKDQRCKGSQSLRAKSNKRLSRRPDHLEP